MRWWDTVLTESVDRQTDADNCNTPQAFWPRGKNESKSLQKSLELKIQSPWIKVYTHHSEKDDAKCLFLTEFTMVYIMKRGSQPFTTQKLEH